VGFEPHRLRYEGLTSALAECRANNLQPKKKRLSIVFSTVDGTKQGVCRAEQAQATADDYATDAEGREVSSGPFKSHLRNQKRFHSRYNVGYGILLSMRKIPHFRPFTAHFGGFEGVFSFRNNPPSSAPQRQKWRILYRSRVQSFKESICATSINIIMCINLIICSLAFFQEIVPNSALRLYFAYIPHEMHEDLLSRQQ
jgi:hypothetical protein